MGFHRIWHGSGQVFDTVDLFLPDVQFPTQVPPMRRDGHQRTLVSLWHSHSACNTVVDHVTAGRANVSQNPALQLIHRLPSLLLLASHLSLTPCMSGGDAERGDAGRRSVFSNRARVGSQATYLRVPHTARKRVAEEGLPFRDGIHGAGHALVNVLPLFLMCAASDMATECDNPYDTRYRPERLLLYDTHPGGIGLAWQARPSAALHA